MPHVILEEKCTGCTLCILACPVDAIHGEKKKIHDISPDICIDCGACHAACAFDAILNHQGVISPKLKRNQKPKAIVDEQHCTGCEKCYERCPFDALYMTQVADEQSFYGIVKVIEKKCTGCRECEWACPYDAIFVYQLDEVPKWIQVAEKTRQPAGANGSLAKAAS